MNYLQMTRPDRLFIEAVHFRNLDGTRLLAESRGSLKSDRPPMRGFSLWRIQMAKKPKLLADLFHDTLKDVYFAEKRILTTLPKMAKAAQSKDLKAAFVKHEGETRKQVERLEGVFKILGKPTKAKTCEAIMGIMKEGAEIMTDYKGMPALDAGLLAAAQAVEHYEMSRYGTLRTWAEKLGMLDAVALLEATLKEEKATDAALTTLAESVVNVEAEANL
jgi:ferritin-like metal-binding protein YciE